MKDIKIRQGETLELSFEADDSSVQTVEFKAVNDQEVVVMNTTASFTDQKATVRVDDTLLPVGEYPYTLTLTYSDGFKEVWSGSGPCGDDCELAKVIICASLEGVS